MNEKLDPKLSDLESRLRTLRPLDVELPAPEPMQTPPKTHRIYGVLATVSATVVVFAVAVVFDGFREQSEHPSPVAVEAAPAEIPEPLVFSTVRSQLALLMEEMPSTSPQPTVRQDYPVLEMTVTRSAVAEPRRKFTGILRGGDRIEFDPEKPFLF